MSNKKDIFYPIRIDLINDQPDELYYIAWHPDLEPIACSACGDTIEEAVEELNHVRREVIEYWKEKGYDIPQPSNFPGI